MSTAPYVVGNESRLQVVDSIISLVVGTVTSAFVIDETRESDVLAN